MSSVCGSAGAATVSRYSRLASSISLLWNSIFYSSFLLHFDANGGKCVSRRYEGGMYPLIKCMPLSCSRMIYVRLANGINNSRTRLWLNIMCGIQNIFIVIGACKVRVFAVFADEMCLVRRSWPKVFGR